MEEIRTKIADVDQDLCERVFRNFVEQVDVRRRAGGQILFFIHKSEMFIYKMKYCK